MKNTTSTKLRQIVEELGIERSRAAKKVGGGKSLRHDFEVNAEDFLQQAEDDFELRGSSAKLNALSNAKRAIHAQMDEVLIALGYTPKKLRFPKKLALFSQLGFVAPRILKRVNDARNVLEHQYKAPNSTRVEEAIDVAALFVGATKRHSDLWEDEFDIGNEDDAIDGFSFTRELSVNFDDSAKAFRVVGKKDVPTFEEIDGGKRATKIGEVKIDASQALFAIFVRLVVAGDRERKSRAALNLLFDSIQL